MLRSAEHAGLVVPQIVVRPRVPGRPPELCQRVPQFGYSTGHSESSEHSTYRDRRELADVRMATRAVRWGLNSYVCSVPLNNPPAPTQSSRCTCRMLPVASVINRSLSGSKEPKDTANCTAVGFVSPDTRRHDCPGSGSPRRSSPDAEPTTES